MPNGLEDILLPSEVLSEINGLAGVQPVSPEIPLEFTVGGQKYSTQRPMEYFGAQRETPELTWEQKQAMADRMREYGTIGPAPSLTPVDWFDKLWTGTPEEKMVEAATLAPFKLPSAVVGAVIAKGLGPKIGKKALEAGKKLLGAEAKAPLGKVAKLTEEDKFRSAWEYYAEREDDLTYKIINDFRSGKDKPQPWSFVPEERIKKIWNDYMDLGFVRDEKAVDNIGNQIVDNIIKLDINTKLAGHSQLDPAEILDTLGIKNLTAKEWDKFYDHIGNRISDYGIDKLQKLVPDILYAETAEKKLLAIDRALNVMHQRTDLAKEFVKSGRRFLDDLSGVTPKQKPLGIHQASPNEFWDLRKQVPEEYQPFLGFYEKPKDFNKYSLYTDEDTGVGYALGKDGYIANVFSTGKTKGAGVQAMDHVLASPEMAGKTPYLDCYDGFLPKWYSDYGFTEYKREAISEYPKGWNYEKYGTPEVVWFKYDQPGQGAVREGIAGQPQVARGIAPRTGQVAEEVRPPVGQEQLGEAPARGQVYGGQPGPVETATAPRAQGPSTEGLGASDRLTLPYKTSILRSDPYVKEIMSLPVEKRQVPTQVQYTRYKNQVNVYEINILPETLSKMKEKPAGYTFQDWREARAFNASPERVAGWHQNIYATADKIEGYPRKLVTGGKVADIEQIWLTEGCQRAATTVERVENGLLPRETNIEACFTNPDKTTGCWVNSGLRGKFGHVNVDVEPLKLATPELIDKSLSGPAGAKHVQQLNKSDFIRMGVKGDDSHAIATGLAQYWLEKAAEKGVKSKTIFISAGYAPVTDAQYRSLAKFKDQFELHISLSGWFPKNDLMFRFGEFMAAKEAGIPVKMRIITNKDAVAGMKFENDDLLNALIKKNKVKENEILETPFHDDITGQHSAPSGKHKYLCCATGQCKSCGVQCMTKVNPKMLGAAGASVATTAIYTRGQED